MVLTTQYDFLLAHRGFLGFTTAMLIAEQSPLAQMPSNPRLILLMEDEKSIRQAMAEILELKGYHVLLAENGQEGIIMFRQYADQIVMVLLDRSMPLMGGVEAMAEIRRSHPKTPVILLSGYEEKENSPLPDEVGATMFLKKPFSLDVFMEQVQKMLHRSL